VAVTANVAPETRQRCIEAGACTYVAKPVESADLLVVLSESLAPGGLAAISREAAC
jgi:CheY-like chemotaxis protein